MFLHYDLLHVIPIILYVQKTINSINVFLLKMACLKDIPDMFYTQANTLIGV